MSCQRCVSSGGRLSEIGWLLRQIQQFVRGLEGDEVASAATGAGTGRELVPQALRHAMQDELDQWCDARPARAPVPSDSASLRTSSELPPSPHPLLLP